MERSIVDVSGTLGSICLKLVKSHGDFISGSLDVWMIVDAFVTLPTLQFLFPAPLLDFTGDHVDSTWFDWHKLWKGVILT